MKKSTKNATTQQAGSASSAATSPMSGAGRGGAVSDGRIAAQRQSQAVSTLRAGLAALPLGAAPRAALHAPNAACPPRAVHIPRRTHLLELAERRRVRRTSQCRKCETLARNRRAARQPRTGAQHPRAGGTTAGHARNVVRLPGAGRRRSATRGRGPGGPHRSGPAAALHGAAQRKRPAGFDEASKGARARAPEGGAGCARAPHARARRTPR